MDEPIVIDAPDNRCFGCSPHNERGLRMLFRRVAPDTVECRYRVPAELCGADGVVHGGVRATLLDEVMGVALHRLGGGDGPAVTVELRLLRMEGRDGFLEGEIEGADGARLTLAEARWRRLDPPGPG